MLIKARLHNEQGNAFCTKCTNTLRLWRAGSVGLAAGLLCHRETLTSHGVEAAQGAEVPRGGSLLKELQIKLDITPKNRTRVRVRAGSACVTTLQHSKARVQRPQRKEKASTHADKTRQET